VNHRLIVFGAVMALAACHTRPVAERPPQSATTPATAPEPTPPSSPPEDSNAESTQVTNADAVNAIPPCLPEVAKPKVAVRRRPRPAQGTEKPTPVETQPPRLGSSTPEVKPIDASVASILGKKVQGSDEGDLGRVVDVQADGDGRVRLVIIEFGGFLGVGNRRAAIDWGLLRFHPDEPDRPITLSVSAKEVQGTPEYRPASHPRALMAPAAAPATDSPPASAPASPLPSPPASPADTSPPQTGSAPPQTK
jgi:hypothetical protein